MVMEGRNTMEIPLIMPGTDRGRVTLKKARVSSAPRSLAASIREGSSLDSVLYMGRIMKGRKS